VLEHELRQVLAPLVREIVKEELERAQLAQRWLPVGQAAEKLGMSDRAVYMRVRRGQLPAKKMGRRLFIDMAAVEHQLDVLP